MGDGAAVGRGMVRVEESCKDERAPEGAGERRGKAGKDGLYPEKVGAWRGERRKFTSNARM